jgi:two-component sensor histidine kinase
MMESTEYKRLLGQRTRALRRSRGLTQANLAERLGITQEYLGKIERGLASPSFPLLLDLSRVLDTEPAELLGSGPPCPDALAPPAPALPVAPAPDPAAVPPRPATSDLGLRELRHRMRNCFQLLSNLVSLELMRARGDETQQVLRDLAARLRCLSLMENHLAESGEGRPLDLGDKLRQVQEAVSGLWPFPAVVAEHHTAPVLVPPDTAQACSLVLTEFLTNMYKHAFPGRDAGRFSLDLSQDNGAVRLVLADDGVGLPPDPAAAPEGTMGLALMRRYVEHTLGGAMRLESRGGATLEVTFPLPPA